MKTALALLSLWALLFPATAAERTLLADDFEQGFAKGWLELSKRGLEIVPEDPGKPEGNKVARLTFGGYLATPPAKPGDTKTATANRGLFDQWTDYELSLRFKVHPGSNPATGKKSDGILFISFRVSPSQEIPWANESLWVVRKGANWQFQPMLSWDGNNIGFDRNRLNKFYAHLYKGKKLDSDWHSVRIRCQGERVQIHLDDKLFFDACDDHLLDGGVFISYCPWKNNIGVPVDIDDVKIIKLEEEK